VNGIQNANGADVTRNYFSALQQGEAPSGIGSGIACRKDDSKLEMETK
jgi:hypothetical protein